MLRQFQFWPNALNSDQVDQIVSNLDQMLTLEDSKVGFLKRDDNELRHCKVGWLNVKDPNVKPVIDMLWHYADLANRESFGFDISSMYDVQYTVYDGVDEDHYDWHHDTFWAGPTAFDRKVSLSIQLTDPSEYEGGDLEFAEMKEGTYDKDAWKGKGTVIAFPSVIRHRVTPVTSGVRKSLVAWVEGPKFR